jgi:hypothetical protein
VTQQRFQEAVFNSGAESLQVSMAQDADSTKARWPRAMAMV